MGSLPRILTVDPTGKIPQQVRGAADLMDRLIIQIDVPGGAEALDELKRAACTAVISAWTPGGNMAGWELAAKVKQIAPNTPIIILADINDTDLDEEMRSASPFVYLKRPFDMAQFLRVLTAALEGEDLFEAMKPPETGGAAQAAPQVQECTPPINQDKAGPRIHQLMTELGSAAVLLCSRDGKVIIEQGVVGYMNRDELSLALVPGVVVGIELRDMLHGNLSELQFYDGDEYDVFVVSVGLHYFIIVIFDGQKGARELGNVSRFGRRCAEDLIALQGMDAWYIERVEETKKTDDAPRRSEVVAQSAAKTTREEPEVLELTPAFDTGKKKATSEMEVAIPETPKMDAIEVADGDLAALFDLPAGDMNQADDMFSLENMDKLAKDDSSNRKGTITWEDAAGLGLVSDAGGGGAD